jgi:hypothetical protein
MRSAIALLVVATGIAGAEPIVKLDASGTCDLSALRARVAMLAGRDPFDDGAREHVVVETTATDATIAMSGNVRVVHAPSCAALVDSIALVIAMALPAEPPHVAQERDEDPAESPSVPLPPERIAAIAGTAVTSAGRAAFVVGARWRSGPRSLGLELRGDPPDRVAVSPIATIAIWSVAATISPCAHVGDLAACALASAGVVHGSSTGLVDPRSATSPRIDVGLRLAWERALSPAIAVRMFADASARLVRTHFDVDEMPVWTSSRFEGLAGLALLLRFP